MTRQQALLLLMVIVFFSSATGNMVYDAVRSVSNSLGVSAYAWILITKGVLALVFLPVLSVWSDSIGRRPLILISLIGKLLEMIIVSFADSITVLAIGQIIGTATDCALVCFTAYAADLTTSKYRAQVFAIVTAVWTMGFAAGTSFGGLLRDSFGNVPLYVAAVIMLIVIVITYLKLPESLKEENRMPFDWKNGNIIGTSKALFTSGRIAALLVVAGLMIDLATSSIGHVKFWYLLIEDPPNYSTIGSATLTQNTFMILIAGIMALIIPSVGRSKVVVAGIVVAVFGTALFIPGPGPWIRIAILLPIVATMASQIILALLSEKAGPQRHGTVIGGMTALVLILNNLAAQNGVLFGYLRGVSPGLLSITAIIPGMILLLSLIPFTQVPAEERI